MTYKILSKIYEKASPKLRTSHSFLTRLFNAYERIKRNGR